MEAKVQTFKREFEIISMNKNKKVDDKSNRFACTVTSMRDLGENLVCKTSHVKTSQDLFQDSSCQSQRHGY